MSNSFWDDDAVPLATQKSSFWDDDATPLKDYNSPEAKAAEAQATLAAEKKYEHDNAPFRGAANLLQSANASFEKFAPFQGIRDRASAGLDTLYDKTLGDDKGQDWSESFKNNLHSIHQKRDEDYGKSTVGAVLGGAAGLASNAVIPSGWIAAPAMGALEGYTRGEELSGEDAAIGAGLGLAGHGLFEAGSAIAKNAKPFWRGMQESADVPTVVKPLVKTWNGIKEVIATNKENSAFQKFISSAKDDLANSMVSRIQPEGSGDQGLRSARAMLDDMSDDQFILHAAADPGPNKVKDWLDQMATGLQGGQYEPGSYKGALEHGIDTRVGARTFDPRAAGSDIAPFADRAGEAVSNASRGRVRTLTSEAANAFDGLDDHIDNLHDSIMSALDDAKSQNSIPSDVGRRLEDVYNIFSEGQAPSHAGLAKGDYYGDVVSDTDRFGRLQKMRELLDEGIDWDAIRTGKRPLNTGEKILAGVRSNVDDILKSSPGKAEADGVYRTMKQIESEVFNSAEQRGTIDKYKLSRLLSDTDSANRFRDNLQRLRDWAGDEQFDPGSRQAVQEFLGKFDAAADQAGLKRQLNAFRYKQGPTSPAIERLGSQLNNNSLVDDAVRSPANFMNSMDNFMTSTAKQVSGKSWNDMRQEEKSAIIKLWTWANQEGKAGRYPTPESLEANYDNFLGKKPPGGGAARTIPYGSKLDGDQSSNMTSIATDAFKRYATSKGQSYVLDQAARAMGLENGIDVFDPMKKDFEDYAKDKWGLSDTEAKFLSRMLPSNPLELMGMVPQSVTRNMGDVFDMRRAKKALESGDLPSPETNIKALKQRGAYQKNKLADEISQKQVPQEEPQKKGPLDHLRAVYDDAPENKVTNKWIDAVDKNGADEPYVGRDVHSVMALANPSKNSPAQPIPVPVEKIGDLNGVLGKGVLNGESDPFAWMDTKYGVTKDLLAREYNKPLDIYTRSDLVGHDDYMENINPKKHQINIVIPGINKQVNRITEPGAPSLQRRIDAANKLADAGYKVNVILQRYSNSNAPGLSDKLYQPADMQMLRELRGMGLSRDVGFQSTNREIDDAAVEKLRKVLGSD